MIGTWSVDGKSLLAFPFPSLSTRLSVNMLKTSGSDIQETQEDTDTARIEISCSVKGYHEECRSVKMWGEKSFSSIRREPTLVSPLWPFKG